MTPEERDALAGEYVLGTLEAGAAREVERALESDAELREAVARWEARLAPLTALAPEEAPPPGLWERIEAALPAAGGASNAGGAGGPTPGAGSRSAPAPSRPAWPRCCCSARRRSRR